MYKQYYYGSYTKSSIIPGGGIIVVNYERKDTYETNRWKNYFSSDKR